MCQMLSSLHHRQTLMAQMCDIAIEVFLWAVLSVFLKQVCHRVKPFTCHQSHHKPWNQKVLKCPEISLKHVATGSPRSVESFCWT